MTFMIDRQKLMKKNIVMEKIFQDKSTIQVSGSDPLPMP